LKDTADWARGDFGDGEAYEEEHEEYLDDGDEGEDEEVVADQNDPAATAGKAFCDRLARIAQNL
jgi:hypothetical protein